MTTKNKTHILGGSWKNDIEKSLFDRILFQPLFKTYWNEESKNIFFLKHIISQQTWGEIISSKVIRNTLFLIKNTRCPSHREYRVIVPWHSRWCLSLVSLSTVGETGTGQQSTGFVPEWTCTPMCTHVWGIGLTVSPSADTAVYLSGKRCQQPKSSSDVHSFKSTQPWHDTTLWLVKLISMMFSMMFTNNWLCLLHDTHRRHCTWQLIVSDGKIEKITFFLISIMQINQ